MEFQVTGSPKAYRNPYGLCVDQFIELGSNGYVINVCTMKRCDGLLTTTANVQQRDTNWLNREEGTGPGFPVIRGVYVTDPFGDWRRTYISTKVRCTAKAVEAQAAEGLAMALADAMGVYNQYVTAGKIDIPVEQSLAAQVKDGNGDAWVAAAESGQVMRIM